MVSEEFISNLAVKYQTSELNIRREYFQHLFLSYFYQQPKSANIYFKGGTALRILHNSPRFSEDLDFDSTLINFKGIEDLLLDALSQMEKENVVFSLKEAKQTTGGFLGVVSFEAFEQPVEIRIEVSLRKTDKKGETVAVTGNDYVPPYNVVAVTEKELISGKMKALLDRKKPRDFYDLYFILRKQLPIPDKKTILAKALTALRASNINFDVELKQFLPKSHWLIIKDFKQTLKREIARNI